MTLVKKTTMVVKHSMEVILLLVLIQDLKWVAKTMQVYLMQLQVLNLLNRTKTMIIRKRNCKSLLRYNSKMMIEKEHCTTNNSKSQKTREKGREKLKSNWRNGKLDNKF